MRIFNLLLNSASLVGKNTVLQTFLSAVEQTGMSVLQLKKIIEINSRELL
jgi:hypothetical protein